jgi:hypothetical protein
VVGVEEEAGVGVEGIEEVEIEVGIDEIVLENAVVVTIVTAIEIEIGIEKDAEIVPVIEIEIGIVIVIIVDLIEIHLVRNAVVGEMKTMVQSKYPIKLVVVNPSSSLIFSHQESIRNGKRARSPLVCSKFIVL